MARPGLQRNRKWPRLVKALGGDEAVARGSLELIWDVAYENGKDVLGDTDDVELAAKWRGERGALTKALLEAGGPGEVGFIEEGGSDRWPEGRPGTYRVHDLWDHAPDYVRKRRIREAEREEKGARLSHSDADGRRSADSDRSLSGQRPPFGGQSPPEDGQCPPDGGVCPPDDGHGPVSDRRSAPFGRPRTPAPAPTPAPARKQASARARNELDPGVGDHGSAPPLSDPTPGAQVPEAPEPDRREPKAPTDAPQSSRPLVVDATEMGPLGAELRARLEQGMNRGLVVAARGQEREVAAEVEGLVEQVGGVDAAFEFVRETIASRRDYPGSMTWVATVLRPIAKRATGGAP